MSFKNWSLPGMVPACNPQRLEAEAKGRGFQGRPGLYSETLSRKGPHRLQISVTSWPLRLLTLRLLHRVPKVKVLALHSPLQFPGTQHGSRQVQLCTLAGLWSPPAVLSAMHRYLARPRHSQWGLVQKLPAPGERQVNFLLELPSANNETMAGRR